MSELDNQTTRVRSRSDVPLVVSSTPAKRSPVGAFAISMSRLLWRRRAESWDREGSTQLSKVVDAVLAECGETSGAVAVDLGCGSGQVTVPLARRCSHILAVDIDTRAIEILTARTARERITNIQAVANPVETLELGPESVDLVVSNYALHHLRDADKRQLIGKSFGWLRPGGRLVIGDMMFGRGSDPSDREIIRQKLRELAGRGPGGWWRIVKNGCRFMFRFQEKPLMPAAWESIVREAGFVNVKTSRVVAEACVISATKPSGPLVHDRIGAIDGIAPGRVSAERATPVRSNQTQIATAARSRLALAGLAAVAVGVAACGGGAGNTAASTTRGVLRVRTGSPPQIYRAKLSGAAEGAGGAPHGVGAAIIAVHGTSVVCWRFAHLHGFVDATSASIDVGAKGKSRRVIVALSNGPRLHHQGCARVSPQVVNAIRRDPSGYYVNILSRQYPTGAVRARL
jgi:ubiquinone/menaquinone biosynthesis C-methylase UbiE